MSGIEIALLAVAAGSAAYGVKSSMDARADAKENAKVTQRQNQSLLEAQQAELEKQTASLEEQKAAGDARDEAARRARAGRNAGRSLLLNDEVGIAASPAAPLQQNLGG